MKKEGWQRFQVLRTLRSKFGSEERNQEVVSVNEFLKKEEDGNNSVNRTHFQKDY